MILFFINGDFAGVLSVVLARSIPEPPLLNLFVLVRSKAEPPLFNLFGDRDMFSDSGKGSFSYTRKMSCIRAALYIRFATKCAARRPPKNIAFDIPPMSISQSVIRYVENANK